MRCPQCGRAPERAGQRICRYCWTPLEGEPEAADAADTEHQPARPRWRPSRRVVLLTGALLAIVVLGFVRTREGEIPPGSTALSADSETSWLIAGGTVGNTRSVPWDMGIGDAMLEVSWTRTFDAGIVTEPVADAGRVYVALEDGSLVATSIETGETAWTLEVPGQLDASPTVAGDLVFLVLRRGALVAVAAGSGEERWTYDAEHSFNSPPVVADGVLYAASHGGALALDAATGEELWRHSFGDLNAASAATARPVVLGQHLALAVNDRVIVFDRGTGGERYSYPIRQARSLAAADGYIVAMSEDRTVAFAAEARPPWWEPARRAWGQMFVWGLAPRPPHHERAWLVETLPGALPPVLTDGMAVLPSGDGRVLARDLATGAIRWEVALDRPIRDGFAVDGRLVLAGESGLSVLDARSGEVLAADLPVASRPLGGAPRHEPRVIATEGAILVADGSGRLEKLVTETAGAGFRADEAALIAAGR